MKFIRIITAILILALTTSPTLASMCATNCASESVMSAMNPDDMSTMTNCHEGSMSKDASKSNTEHQSTAEHKSCTMGAGCNVAQAVPIDLSSKYALIDSFTVSFPYFYTSEKSVDLSPPLKPPA